MPIVLHRSNRTDVLVEALCAVLRFSLPADPFLAFPVVVGSRGMERWLRHEIATRLEISAGLAFPFPRQALAGAARWLLDGAVDPAAAFWEPDAATPQASERWERDALALQLIPLLRAHRGDPSFQAVDRYLAEGPPGTSVSARELLFASELADVLDRLMHDRPDDSLDWAHDPASAGVDHRWLGLLLADLGAHSHPQSPAVLHRALMAAALPATPRSLCIFGLSTMGPGDRQRLAAIAQAIEVHLFVLVPTTRFLKHQYTRAQANAARREAKTDAERRRVEAELSTDNPILRSLGAPSRDLQAWLEDFGYESDLLPSPDPAATDQPSLLQRLQSWVLAAEGLDAVAQPWPVDASLSLHASYGALRQCEVLRDELLAMFAEDDSLEPRQIVVMTPDIETYAPLVAAVFSRSGQAKAGQDLPSIPVSIADLGLSRTNPVAEVLLKTLEVAGERLTASWLLDFLALQPVRERWKLDEHDLSDLRQLIGDSGLRWGADAADRAAVDQPALDQNTVRFALERLALGVLMPDEGGVAVVPDPSNTLNAAVPHDIESRDRVQRVGQLTGILRTLVAQRAALQGAATLELWRDRLVLALDQLAATNEKSGWLRAEVDASLDQLAQLGSSLGGLEIEPGAVLRWLQGRYQLPQRGDRAITGAVQVCSLEPMRTVPFRVVVLLGMDDGSFPRGDRARTWDPMEQRRPGERDRRELDRHMMLEAMLSASERLIILWSGHDLQQGQAQPAAVPVEELIDTLGALTQQPREGLVHHHPLQPWSAVNFGATAVSFDQSMARAAHGLREIAHDPAQARVLGLAASGEERLPPESQLPTSLELDDLAEALLAPHKLLLRDRLGLSVSYEQAALADREPLELDSLDSWSLRQRAIEQLLRDPTGWTDAALVDALERRLGGEGTLPLRAGGRVALAKEVALARDVLHNLNAIGGQPAAPLELSLALDGPLSLVGRVARLSQRDGGLLLQWYTPSKAANVRLKMRAWVHLLAAIACEQPVEGARLVGFGAASTPKGPGGEFLAFEGGADQARAVLQALAQVWREARCCPLPLFPKTSSAAADVLRQIEDQPAVTGLQASLLQAVNQAWRGGYRSSGDVDDRWISTFFVDYDPLDHLDGDGVFSFMGLARRVWLPLHRGLQAGDALRAGWAQGAGQ